MTQNLRPSDKPPAAAPRNTSGSPDSGFALAAGMEPFSREELLARYRRQRTLPSDPFECLGKPAQPRVQPQLVETAAKTAPAATVERRGLSMGQTFAVAAAMALAAGAGAGMMNAKLFSPGGGPAPLAESPAPVQASMAQVPATPPPVQTTVINKKPVATAKLEVSDTTGETNSFIPLALKAEPADARGDILLKISGIPEGAYLTSGRKQEDEIWAVTRAELKDLRLVVPEAEEPRIDLAVAAFEPNTGELAAPVKTMTVALSDVVVQPAAAPPPTQTPAAPVAAKSGHPAPIPVPDSISLALAPPKDATAARTLVLEGDTLLKSGDVRLARASYEKAWAEGSPAGAYGMARSFDPVVLGGLALKNDKPDKARALEWYERAATAGHAGAADSIVRLRLKP